MNARSDKKIYHGIIFEHDGDHHQSKDKQRKKDKARDDYYEKQGYLVIRITRSDILKDKLEGINFRPRTQSASSNQTRADNSASNKNFIGCSYQQAPQPSIYTQAPRPKKVTPKKQNPEQPSNLSTEESQTVNVGKTGFSSLNEIAHKISLQIHQANEAPSIYQTEDDDIALHLTGKLTHLMEQNKAIKDVIKAELLEDLERLQKKTPSEENIAFDCALETFFYNAIHDARQNVGNYIKTISNELLKNFIAFKYNPQLCTVNDFYLKTKGDKSIRPTSLLYALADDLHRHIKIETENGLSASVNIQQLSQRGYPTLVCRANLETKIFSLLGEIEAEETELPVEDAENTSPEFLSPTIVPLVAPPYEELSALPQIQAIREK